MNATFDKLSVRDCSLLKWLPLLLLCACGGGKSSNGAKKAPASANTSAPTTITAYGDNCASTGVATTVVGIDARIGLSIANFDPSRHALGYVGQVSNLRLSTSEAVLTAPQAGTFSVTIVVRNVPGCEQQSVGGNAVADCRPQGVQVQNILGDDIQKKITFIVSASMQDFLQSGTLGTGQDGAISDAVNNKGLIGFIGKLGILNSLGGAGGGGGGIGSITGILGSAQKANQALDQAKAQGQAPKGGCTQNPSQPSLMQLLDGGAK